MSDENKKKVALGTTLALLLGAGSYYFLASGGGNDSDGLNSGRAGQKEIRVASTDEPMTHKGNRRPKYAENGFKGGKKHRGFRTANPNGGKTKRYGHNRDVTIKKKTRPPAA